MASGSMKDIKTRIKSVESTMQITKAMELVASSKLRKAREKVDMARPYFLELHDTLGDIAAANTDFSSAYLVQRPVNKSGYVLIRRGQKPFSSRLTDCYLLSAARSLAGVVLAPLLRTLPQKIRSRRAELHRPRHHLLGVPLDGRYGRHLFALC